MITDYFFFFFDFRTFNTDLIKNHVGHYYILLIEFLLLLFSPTSQLHRQENQLEELQESNCELQQQINHLQSSQQHKQQFLFRGSGSLKRQHLPRYNTHDGSSSARGVKSEQPQSLLSEISSQGNELKEQKSRIPTKSQGNERNQKSVIFQKKPKSLSLEMPQKLQVNESSDGSGDASQQKEILSESTVCSKQQSDITSGSAISSDDFQEGTQGHIMEENYLPIPSNSNNAEQSLFAELCNSLNEEQNKNSQSGSLKPTHRRNASDCSLSSLTEGSRKRQHNNIKADSDESDEDSPDRTGCKQTLYSQDRDSHDRLSHNSSFEIDASTSKPRWDNNGYITSWSSTDKIYDCIEGNISEITPYHLYPIALDELDPVSLQLAREMNMGASCDDDTKELASGPRLRDLSQFTELSPVSELPPPSQEAPAEQSLFSELSTQMGEEKHGSGSETSSGCAMGVFDFSTSHSSQDVEVHSPVTDVPNHRQKMESEIVSFFSDTIMMHFFYVSSNPHVRN